MKTKEDRNNVEKQNSIPKVSSDRCINPYKVGKEKGHIGKSLRKISGSLLKKFPNLPNTAKVCSACRKKVTLLIILLQILEFRTICLLP